MIFIPFRIGLTMKPPSNKKPIKKQLIKLKCANCSKQFFITKQNYHKNSKNHFCSRNCNYEYKKPKKCQECGSKKLYFSGWQKQPALCKSCFDKWRIKRHEIILTCIDCGVKKIVKYHVSVKDRKLYQCKMCDPVRSSTHKSCKIYFTICLHCRKLFTHHTSPNRKYCSSSCRIECNSTPIKDCVYCGVNLKENKTHAHHTHATCDICEWAKRRIYKDKYQHGKFWYERNRLLIIHRIAGIGLTEDIKKRKRGILLWKSRLEAIGKVLKSTA